MEKCIRCGEVDDDRRTLWHSSLYEMAETGIPFRVVQTPRAAEEDLPKHFYTLRVCKDCRADWMIALKQWFESQPYRPEYDSGIFVREYGTNREISRAEWDRRNPGRTPVTWKKGSLSGR